MKEIKDLGFGVIQVNETKPTISKMESVDNYRDMWQKLKEWLEYRTAENGVFDNYDSLAVEDNLILDKMQELGAEDGQIYNKQISKLWMC